MRTPDQDERPEPGTAGEALGDGFGSVDVGDLTDGYGADEFYPDYGDSDDPIDPDDTYGADDTFDDAVDDDGGFGADDGGIAVGGDGDGSGLGEVLAVGNEASDDGADNILEEILDDIFGDDADDVVLDAQTAPGMDAGDLLSSLDEAYVDDEGFGLADIADDGGSEILDPFDGGDVTDAADYVSQSDFDLNTDGHVDGGDLHEAAHPFDFHVDGGG
jgi:hypothetical protein